MKNLVCPQIQEKKCIGRDIVFHIFGNFGAQSRHKTSQKKSKIAGTSYIWRCLHSNCRHLLYMKVPAFFQFLFGFWAGLNLQIHPPSTYQSLPKYRHLQLVYNRFASCEHIYGDASVGACTCMCVSMCGHLRDSSCYAYCIRLSRALV